MAAAGWSALPPDLVRRVADSLLATNDLDCYMHLHAASLRWRAATEGPKAKGSSRSDCRFEPCRWILLDEAFQSKGEEMLLVNTDTSRFLRRRDYSREQTKDAIVAWISKKLGPVVQNLTAVEEAEKIITGDDVAVLAYLHHLSVSTLIIAEHEGGLVKPSSLSALVAAEAIAKENKVSLLLGGSGPTLHKAAQHVASSHPLVNEVLVADSDVFAHPLAEPWDELLCSVQQKGGYSHVITSSTLFGKNLLPRAAALLDVSPVTDVTTIFEPRVFVRPIYAGNALCTVRYTGESPCMMSIRSTSFSPATESMSETKVAPITQVDLSFLSEDHGSVKTIF
ncbi:hypothetical protein ZWY2020_027645 [Hordeum vulgare]|nr:hypothetical protein ZWY2020_027645 [Hordeum vulgare]